MTRQEVLDWIVRLIAQTKTLIRNHPRNALLPAFETELLRYQDLVQTHWPLPAEASASVDLGQVAVREMLDEHPAYVTEISRLCAVLRGD